MRILLLLQRLFIIADRSVNQDLQACHPVALFQRTEEADIIVYIVHGIAYALRDHQPLKVYRYTLTLVSAICGRLFSEMLTMKPSLALMASAASLVCAEDLLFPRIRTLEYSNEYLRAQALNISSKAVDIDEWYNMTTADFAQFKAIVIVDTISYDRSLLTFLNDTKEVWAPAVRGNVILIGTYAVLPHEVKWPTSG